MPSSLEYWHIGETNTRLGKVTERSRRGEKRREVFVDTAEGGRERGKRRL
jgi:hypothetical protein